MNFFGISSLLGPPVVACHRCGTPVATGRVEWCDFDRFGKGWFFGVSILYLAMLGFFGGISTDATYQFVHDGTWKDSLRFSESTFWLGVGVWAMFVVFTQAYRIVSSLRRSQATEQKPLPRSLRSLQIGMQLKCFLLLVLIPALAWLGRLAWDKFGGG